MDSAVQAARATVGFGGDPTISWSIAVGCRFVEPLAREAVQARIASVVERYRHLGRPPALSLVADDDWDAHRDRLLDTAYGDADPLTRVAMSLDGRRLLVAAHHGAIDGLGLVGLLGRISGIDLTSNVQGVGTDAEPRGFIRRSAFRVAEALLRPPARLAGPGRSRPEDGDWQVRRSVPMISNGTAGLIAAVARTAVSWPTRSPGRTVVSLGLSRRPGAPAPEPDRDTAFSRLVLAGTDVESVREVLRTTAPEPPFPESTSAGLAPKVAALLAPRLGATVLVSNLGRLAAPGVLDPEFWPAPGGPAGVGVGLISDRQASTLTVRARRGWFTFAETQRLAERIAEELLVPAAAAQ